MVRPSGHDRPDVAAARAVRSTFHTVGHALLTTTVVLSAGFMTFATSGFEVSWSLGLLVTMTIILVADHRGGPDSQAGR